MSKIITIIGGNGYVGMRCIKTLLNTCKDIKIYSIARNFELHNNPFDERVEFIRGDALKPDSISQYIAKSSGVIHTVGKLISTEDKNSNGSYEKINYETAINMAKLTNDINTDMNTKKNFVYISAERGFVFPLSLLFSGYIESKRKAELKLIKDYPKINPIILRPGLITDLKDRAITLPISYVFDISHFLEKNVINSIAPGIGNKINLPAASIQLDILCMYIVSGVLGKLDPTMKIYSNDYMNELNNLKNIKFD